MVGQAEPSPPISTLAAAADVLLIAAFTILVSSLIEGEVHLHLYGDWSIGWAPALVGTITIGSLRHWFQPKPTVFTSLLSLIRRWWSSPVLRNALQVVLVTRGAVFVAGFLALALIGPAVNAPAPAGGMFASLPEKWDAEWYVGIAAGGYRWSPEEPTARIAFFPGFPLTVRVAGSLLHLPDRVLPWIWTGVALSLLSFLLALIYLWLLAQRFGLTDQAATDACWLIASYPFSLFYGQHYTESLFLLCAVLAAYHLSMDRPVRSAFFGFAVGLVRPTGILVTAPLAVLAYHFARSTKGSGTRLAALLAVCAPILGLATYAAHVHHVTGDWLSWMGAQSRFGREWDVPWRPFVDVARYVGDHGIAAFILRRPYDAVNAAAGSFALACVIPVWRRFGVGMAAFVFFGTMLPMTVGGLPALGRYTSVLFPIFLWLGTTGRVSRGLILAFATLQVVLAALFFTFRDIF